MAEKKKYDIIIMDIMMPEMDGYEACKKIRNFSKVPIVILTAKNEEEDYLEGFQCGADDYVAKPFSPKVLIARIKAILRRDGKRDKKYDFGELKLDTDSMKAFFRGEDMQLTAKEYDLLFFMIENAGIALSREKIIDKVWGYDFFGDPRTIDTHIKRLRKKLDDKYIETIRGLGYRFEEEK
jgi:DNA-binding response OmpR family regulator